MYMPVGQCDAPDFLRKFLPVVNEAMYAFDTESDLAEAIATDPVLRHHILTCTYTCPALSSAQQMARSVDARIAAVDASR